MQEPDALRRFPSRPTRVRANHGQYPASTQGHTTINPASSAFLFSPQKTDIIGPFMAAPCKARTTGVGVLPSYFLGMWTRYERSRPSTFRLRVWSPGFNIGSAAQKGGGEKE